MNIKLYVQNEILFCRSVMNGGNLETYISPLAETTRMGNQIFQIQCTVLEYSFGVQFWSTVLEYSFGVKFWEYSFGV